MFLSVSVLLRSAYKEAIMELVTVISTALILVFVAERLTEYVLLPIVTKVASWFQREIDRGFWAKISILVIGAGLSVAASINFFGDIFFNQWIGIGLSALFVGGGSELLHQLIEALNRSNR